MKIDGDGFLSETGQEKAHQIAACNDLVFSALERTISEMRTFASSQEVRDQNTDEERQKIIALVLAARVLEISEAALLVMKNGMSNEANTLFRVFLDAYFVIANVCSDAAFVANYFKSDEAARLKLLNAAKKHDSELFEAINEYASKTLHDTLQKKIAEERIQAFNSHAYAENIGCSAIYDSMYRVASGSLHTTPRALEKYVEEDDDGNVILIKDYPLEGDIPQRAYDLSYFLIKVLGGLKAVFGCLDEAEIQGLITSLNESAKNET
jgi:hypothetical protein